MLIDLNTLKIGLLCLCPSCTKTSLYKSQFSLELKKRCEECNLDLAKNDSADGPAVFLIFVLGSMLVPLALWSDAVFHMPLWLHAVLWGGLALLLTIGALKPLKSYIIALQYKHRPGDWKS